MQPNWRTTLRKVSLPATIIFLFVTIAVTSALTLNSVTPNWSNPVGSSGPVTCQTFQTTGNETQIRFGDDDVNSGDCPSDPNTQSGLGYEGTSTTATFDSGAPFVLGEITHYNNSVIASSLLQSVDLDLAIDFGDPAYTDTFSTTVTIDETANLLNTCPYGDSQPCADQITLNRTSSTFMAGASEYQFEILGMIPGSLGSCSYDESQISTSFISDEAAANSACVFGRLTLLEDAAVELTKDTDPGGITTVAPGDILDFKIDYECTSIVSSCLNVEILDTLPDEFIFVGSTGSIHFNTGVYSEDNNSVRWDLRSNLSGVLSAGSTGFVRVRVQVRDDGTIPDNQPLDNIVISTLDNGPTYQTSHTVTNSATSNWIVNKVDPGNVYLDTNRPTTDASYTVQICSNGSTVNLLNAQMVDTLPAGFEFTGASGGGVYDAGPPQTVTWELGDLSADSGCTSRTIEGRFPSPPFSDGEQVTNSVTGSGTPVGEPEWTDTDDVTNTLETLVPNPSATLSKAAVRNDYPIGAEAQFRLSPANTGNITLLNFIVTDTVPPEMDVTRITVGSYNNFGGQQVTIRYQTNFSGGFVDWPGGPFDDNNQQLNTSSLGLGASEYITGIQWDYGSVLPGFSTNAPARLYGTVINPDNNGDPVTAGQNINNEAVLTYEFPDGAGGTGSGSSFDGASLTITTAPNPAFSKNSAGGVSSQWRFLIGQQVGYYQLDPDNNTGIALDNLSIEDAVPPQFNVISVTSGSYNNGGGVTTTVSYQTNLSGGFNVLGSSPGTTNATFAIPALAAGEYVTHVRWEYGTVPAEFSASTRPRISGEVINPDNNGNPVDDGDSMTNNATMRWEFEGIPESRSDGSTDTVREPVAQPALSKSTLTSGPYIPTSVVTYSLRVGAAGSSPSVMPNPIVMDLLPEGMIYMPGTWAFNPGGTGSPAPAFEVIEDYNSTGRTLLRWTFNHTFVQGQYATITFDAGLSAGVSQGSMENTYYVTSDDIPLQSGDPDSGDLDGDGNSGDLIAGSSTSILIDELVGLNSVKGVMGELDSEFSVYPETGRTLPNGDITYRLSIINQGNIPINNVKVVDILPFIGDTGVRDLSQRGTEWRPFLTGLVASPPGVTVYYSTSMNPCRPDIVPSGPASCTPPNWSTLPPADITTVQSLRFDFADVLEPGESFNFTWNMQAPASAPEGAIAWNSFAFTSTNADTGIPLRPAEPNKVGIEIETPEIAPLIQLEKATNGEDADLPTGPLVPLGDPVTWSYVITNTGNTRLANITLTDDQLGAIVCNEADPIPNLDPGESFTCTAPAGVSVAGQYTNTGTVEGTPVDDSDVPLIDPDTGNPVPPVEDSDPSHYYGYNPNLARLGDYVWIDMNGNGVQDAGEAGLPGITVNLYDGTNALVDTTITDGNGLYNFVDIDVSVTGNDYVVEFVLPGVYSFTEQNQGGDDTADSDADPTTGRTATITLNAGDDDRTWDAGVVPPASIGDFVWIDSDGDGVQDAGEPGLSNVTVRLYKDELIDTLIGTTSTDPDGAYSFTDLEPGDYFVEFALPNGYIFTRFNSSGDATADSDADRTTGQTATTTLSAGENDPTWDAGVVSPAAIGNFVWEDMDADGVQDGGEPGIPNVTVELYDSDDNLIDTTITDGNGSYSFIDLLPGEYYLEFTLPPDYEFSEQDATGDTNDSDADTTTGQTGTIDLSPGETDNTWDAGMFRRASIGNFVWDDLDFDGIQNGGDIAVPGVTVELFNDDDESQGTTTTNGTGQYLFDNLIPGNYYLVFSDLPAGYALTQPNQGGNDAVDSDPNVTTGRTATTLLESNEDDMRWDAGIVQLATLGDYVWEDVDGNGVQDGGEPPISNVTVELYNSGGSLVDTTTTGGSGDYLFTDVYPGDYTVRFVPPTGYAITQQNQGGDDTGDSDADPTNGETDTITLMPGDDDRTWDAGMYRPVTIGDRVWRDIDHDGIQDGGETGIEGITVHVYDSDDNLIDTTTTDPNGNYSFTTLPPGTYYVEFVLPAVGYEFTLQDQAGDDALDSDADFTSGQTATTTLNSGESDLTLDAGLFPLASIGDYVWHDLDADGIQDGLEAGIAAVTVELYDGDDNFVANTTTNGFGFYEFVNLQPGDYYLEFTRRIGFNAFSPANAGANDTLDSDAVPFNANTARTATTTLDPDEDDITWDAGLYQYAAIGDYVWEDTNGDGVQDGTEPGIENVTVELFNSSGVSQGTTTTDANGAYHFFGLVPGEYYVVFTPPAGYEFTLPNVGDEDDDSDANPANGRTANTTLTSGEIDYDWDAGLYRPASIGDYVWHDINGDGVQDGTEPALANVTVRLLNGAGNLLHSTTTDTNGAYLFDDLAPGTYYVDFVPLPGYAITTQDAGGDNTLDSDADRSSGETDPTQLSSGEDDDTWDAGMYIPATLGNFVWADLNMNGIQDGGEFGVPGVTVTLYDDAIGTVIETTTTNGSGFYLFDNLQPGDYYVVFTLPDNHAFSPQDQGVDDEADSDADTANGQTTTITLISDQDDLSWDAGVFPLASLGDFVWEDTNANGVQDAGEPGVENVTVTLYDSGGSFVTDTTTDANGAYLFDTLIPGDYSVGFSNLPAGHEFTQPGQGTQATDSDVDPISARTATITLAPDEDDMTWDAGIFQRASLGDFVWEDTNANGVQDAGEPGVENVTVTLYDSGGSAVANTTTDTNGAYLFDDLIPGDYSVEFTLPTGYEFSPQGQGTQATDSDANITTGRTIATTLDSGENDLTWDAGIFQRASLGDFVWEDTNANGVQDAGEPGVENVTVTLFDSGGSAVANTTTDANGAYLFDDLVPSDYSVEFTLPTGYEFSPQGQGTQATDSDADTTTGQTIATTLVSGENDLTWDAGIFQRASLGDFVWEDTNANGVQDAGEPGVENVTVTLYDSGGGSVANTTTDANGAYLFDDLIPGDYSVGFTLPTGYEFSPQDAGGDDALDSDADTTTGQTIAITLDSGENDLTWDAGIFQRASLGDFVWHDRDRDGVQDTNEPGVENITVELFDSSGNLQGTTTTDVDGFYLFDNLLPGDYYLVFSNLPSGYIFSTKNRGSDTALDSDVDSKGQTLTITLQSGQHDTTWDAGIHVPPPSDDFTAEATPEVFSGLPEVVTPPTSPGTCQQLCTSWQLYHTNQTGDWEIFRLGELDGKPSISANLSQGLNADDMAPSRSPNAEWIVFASNRDGNWEIYVAPADGDSSQIRRVTHNEIAIDTDPVWGPNNYVIFETTRNGNWDLYQIDMTTGGLRQLTFEDGNDLNAFWSPDGSKIVFQSDRSGQWQIYELDLVTLSTTLLSDGTGVDVDPQYSNGGDRIAFRSYRDGSESVIYIMDADGTNLMTVSDLSGDATNHSWSPDDMLIAYQSDLDGDLDVYVYEVGSGATRQLTDNDIPDYAPSWQCSSTRVLFTSDINGNPDIFDADALPISQPAIEVDEEAIQLTVVEYDDIYPLGAPLEENASREGRLPQVGLGEQTTYLRPEVSTTRLDISREETDTDWDTINGCPVP